MTRIVRLSDVAKAAGVSQGTASNVFNRPDIVRKEVRDRVEAAARALGYAGPDPKGRLLRAGKVNAIGVATAEPLSYFFEDPFARVLMAGIAGACDQQGAGLALVSAANEEKLAWNIQSAIVDGFVLFCIEGGPRLVESTRGRRLPFVALGLDNGDETVAAIGIDDFAGARIIADHLAALGHRRFAMLTLPLADGRVGPITEADIEAAVYVSAVERIRGYHAALAAHGIDIGAVPMFETENDRESAEAALTAIFAAPEPPTAILAMSDRLALLTLDWLRARGLHVPGDISVVGFDGVPEGARSDPPLTTMTQPIEKIGRLAVRMIFDEADRPRRLTVDVALTLRASTAPPRVAPQDGA